LVPATGRGVLRAAAALARKQKAYLLTSFDGFDLNEAIMRAIAEEKYAAPSPIQEPTISIATSRRDVIRVAQTGTSKPIWMSSSSRRPG
jgi:ATP-dependent RNA helicase RhlE